MEKINTTTKNIMTLEDPIEYSLSLIRQAGINNKAGFDFATGLRALLRQDPDVLMIGEIRDAETASIAIRAAMTGHQVFSTLHTNDAISGVARLIDIGVAPFLLSGSLTAIIAQRLARKLCNSCKKPYKADRSMVAMLNGVLKREQKEYTLFSEHGCATCHHIGYKGRTAIAEAFYINKAIADEISKGAGYVELLSMAYSAGFVPMQEDGLYRIMNGETSVAELRRTVNMNEYIADDS